MTFTARGSRFTVGLFAVPWVQAATAMTVNCERRPASYFFFRFTVFVYPAFPVASCTIAPIVPAISHATSTHHRSGLVG